jgi:23S rRNA pseudouridine2605 synthase
MQERLQKIIAAAGIASRRKAEELIAEGQVTVNGKVVSELGTKADPETDHIKVNGRLINQRLREKEKIYLLLNKPVGWLSSTDDPQQRPLVVDLVGKYRDKVHPVGRLDFNSEGLLLLTNDGAFHHLIAHASSKVLKRYHVKVKGQPDEQKLEKLRRGITLDGHRTQPAQIRLLEHSDTNAWFEVILSEGRNQQIRKMFDAVGHSVLKLRRTAIGFLHDEKLKPGEFRELTADEVRRFFRGAVRPEPEKLKASPPRAHGAVRKKSVAQSRKNTARKTPKP